MIENNNPLNNSDNNIINNNHNENLFKKESVIQTKEMPSKTNISHALYYIFYFSVIILVYALFFINYSKTNNWYEENTHYINLRPISICTGYIKKFEICLNESKKSTNMLKREGDKYVYDTKTICKEDNDKLQTCFDDVHLFSQRCQIYLNELYLCKNKGNKIKACINNNLVSCWRPFNLVDINKVFEQL